MGESACRCITISWRGKFKQKVQTWVRKGRYLSIFEEETVWCEKIFICQAGLFFEAASVAASP